MIAVFLLILIACVAFAVVQTVTGSFLLAALVFVLVLALGFSGTRGTWGTRL